MRRRAFFAIISIVSVVVIVSGEGPGHAQQSGAQPPRWPLVRGRGVCFTQSGWCPINGSLPVGAACYCTIPPNTHIYGVVTTHEYSGHVNPYFNPHAPPVPSTIR